MERGFNIHTFDPKTAGMRMYCGPTVLKLLTGKDPIEIRTWINREKRKRGAKVRKAVKGGIGFKLKPWPLNAPVRGLATDIMDALLCKMAGNVKAVKCPRQALRTFAAEFSYVKKPIVLVSGNHYLVLHHGMVYDTYSPDGAAYAEHAFRDTRVVRYWIIDPASVRDFAVKLPPVRLPRAKAKRDLPALRSKKARAMAEKWERRSRAAAKLAKKWAAKVRYYEKKESRNETAAPAHA